MSKIEKSIEVGVPASVAYNQWTQFEEFPRFMEGVESVHQLDDRRLRWRAEIGGKTLEWEADITEQIPDKRIAWTSVEGARNAGVVTFHRLSDDRLEKGVIAMVQEAGRALSTKLGFLSAVGKK